ncbi:MAG: molecular chaperone TorD family protein [Burkholderiales bacterium]|nr:molecular chaperone TorD family protein [Burkholderiales bacterium]
MPAATASRAGRERARACLAWAARLKALAEAFAYPEDGHARRTARLFAQLAPTEDEPPSLARARVRAARAWAGTDDEAARDEYARLFLGGARCPMRETAYGDGRRLGGRSAELADIGGFYAAFGFAIADADRQPPDHLCTQLEFSSLLLVKIAWGVRDGWTERGRIAEAALRRFLEDHLGRWTRAFCDEVGLAAARSPYRESTALLDGALAAAMRRLQVAPTPLRGLAPPDVMQADVFECPRADAAQTAA